MREEDLASHLDCLRNEIEGNLLLFAAVVDVSMGVNEVKDYLIHDVLLLAEELVP